MKDDKNKKNEDKKNDKNKKNDELPSAEPKKSIISKMGPHGPGCSCEGEPPRFRLHIEADFLVQTKADAEQVTRMFNTLGLVLKATGTPGIMSSDVFMKAGDNGKEKPNAPEPTKPPIHLN